MEGLMKLEASIGYADMIRIVFADKCVERFLGDKRCLDFTFREVMETASRNGWKEGVILLIAESPLEGRVYQYGNYGAFWVEHGTTRGYA